MPDNYNWSAHYILADTDEEYYRLMHASFLTPKDFNRLRNLEDIRDHAQKNLHSNKNIDVC